MLFSSLSLWPPKQPIAPPEAAAAATTALPPSSCYYSCHQHCYHHLHFSAVFQAGMGSQVVTVWVSSFRAHDSLVYCTGTCFLWLDALPNINHSISYIVHSIMALTPVRFLCNQKAKRALIAIDCLFRLTRLIEWEEERKIAES